MHKIYQRISLLLMLGLVTAPVLADKAGEQTESTQPPQAEQRLPLNELRLFTQIFDHIRNAYVEEIDDKTLLENAISGMLSGLDPHSRYLDKKAFAELRENSRGEFGGIGIEVGMEKGAVLVIAPIDDTPAQRAGIQPGDLIIKIDDTMIKGLSQSEAIELMRGPKDSKVTLTIIRKTSREPLIIELARDLIKTRSVRHRILEPGYGYIRIAQFQEETASKFRQALMALQEAEPPLKGLVLDLRNNPGGLLPAAIDVSDALMDGGLITYTEGRLSSANIQYNAKPGSLVGDIPMVVIIDGGSASASEIVAGSLQDHRRAILIGTQSFGKGSVQTVMPISKFEGIKITTARYFTPSGRSIQAEGITPDIVVQRAEVKTLHRTVEVKESNLDGHLNNTQQHNETYDNDAPKVDPSKDNQLYEGLNLLKAAYLLSQKPAI